MILFWGNKNYDFFSNFYNHPIVVNGIEFPSVEHFYQWSKSDDIEYKNKIMQAPYAGKAKRIGKKAKTVSNWDNLKSEVMLVGLKEKFKDPILQEKLLDTGYDQIIENSPFDKYWGTGDDAGFGSGKNMLGKMLMFIREYYRENLVFPIKDYNSEIPNENHAGAFGTKRKFDIHTGIDLYTNDGANVYSISSGEVIGKIAFTGQKAGSPWWEDTSALIIRHSFGIFIYGEVVSDLNIGNYVTAGQKIGQVKKVLKKDKGTPQSMLHMEMYNREINDGAIWLLDQELPSDLLNLYPFLNFLNTYIKK